MTLPPASRRSVALVAIGAALLVASYPPFRLPLLSFVAVAPAVVLLRRLEQECHPRDALRWGFAYGFVTQGAVLYWLVVALWHFTPLSALGYVATIAIFGLWHGLLFWFVLRVRRRLPAVPPSCCPLPSPHVGGSAPARNDPRTHQQLPAGGAPLWMRLASLGADRLPVQTRQRLHRRLPERRAAHGQGLGFGRMVQPV